jgi:tetratricopeptide (TPR) repeat protein
MNLVGGFAPSPIPAAVPDPQLIANTTHPNTHVATFLPRRVRAWCRWVRSKRTYSQDSHRRTITALCDLSLLDLAAGAGTGGDHACICAHPLVVETTAALSERDPKRSRVISMTVVSLLSSATARRNPENLSDAAFLSLLAPHVTYMLSRQIDHLPKASVVAVIDAANTIARGIGVIGGDYLGYFAVARLTHTVAAKFLRPGHHSALSARHGYAAALALLGRYDDALAENIEVLNGRRRRLGPTHAETLCTRHNFAYILAGMGRFDEAQREYLAVLEVRRRILGLDHPRTLRTRLNRAKALVDGGSYDDAEQEFRDLADSYSRTFGPDHYETLENRHGLARALAGQRRFDEAKREYDVALEGQQRLGREHPETLDLQCNLAEVLVCLGQHEQAGRIYRETAEGYRRVLGPDHPSTQRAESALRDLQVSS